MRRLKRALHCKNESIAIVISGYWEYETGLLEIINISSAATERKRIAYSLPFENQLFGYIHYIVLYWNKYQVSAKHMQFSP